MISKYSLNIRSSIFALLFFTILFGIIYPLLITGISRYGFADKSAGSLIKDNNGEIIGSKLIGQNFASDKYFWGRLSATSPSYNASASSGSNFGVNNPKLLEIVTNRVNILKTTDNNNQNIPIDLVTSSASGLDPDISIEAAKFQIARIAKARNLDKSLLEGLIKDNTINPSLGFLGSKRVNVLTLNIKLDQINTSNKNIN